MYTRLLTYFTTHIHALHMTTTDAFSPTIPSIKSKQSCDSRIQSLFQVQINESKYFFWWYNLPIIASFAVQFTLEMLCTYCSISFQKTCMCLEWGIRLKNTIFPRLSFSHKIFSTWSRHINPKQTSIIINCVSWLFGLVQSLQLACKSINK